MWHALIHNSWHQRTLVVVFPSLHSTTTPSLHAPSALVVASIRIASGNNLWFGNSYSEDQLKIRVYYFDWKYICFLKHTFLVVNLWKFIPNAENIYVTWMNLQEWFKVTKHKRDQHANEGWEATSTMHIPYVPYSSALACETQLQRLLARQNCNHKFQLSNELHAMDTCGTTSQP